MAIMGERVQKEMRVRGHSKESEDIPPGAQRKASGVSAGVEDGFQLQDSCEAVPVVLHGTYAPEHCIRQKHCAPRSIIVKGALVIAPSPHHQLFSNFSQRRIPNPLRRAFGVDASGCSSGFLSIKRLRRLDHPQRQQPPLLTTSVPPCDFTPPSPSPARRLRSLSPPAPLPHRLLRDSQSYVTGHTAPAGITSRGTDHDRTTKRSSCACEPLPTTLHPPPRRLLPATTHPS
ncbi:hypothetical protein P154DRAFT_577935 [Amniculicola lignicola CBS 123094]|uniref:Uncharacterized protein n=1 Tax=Amniculicola lignicola CBS 123094 TaxID=1392246 RepID=A0A6A5WGN7_9PLEO|nr:hypothetical protein P154DRAFT_577935 [Amniculicola lignicola CBS 123094]